MRGRASFFQWEEAYMGWGVRGDGAITHHPRRGRERRGRAHPPLCSYPTTTKLIPRKQSLLVPPSCCVLGPTHRAIKRDSNTSLPPPSCLLFQLSRIKQYVKPMLASLIADKCSAAQDSSTQDY